MSDARATESVPNDDVQLTEKPPETIGGILRRLGPGLIIAGSIVGSGELIATTLVGATAGFWLLWLILLGCVIKVFVQVEFGKYSIITGKTTMTGLSEVPGPRIKGHGNWLVWYWVVMFLASLGQLGGIVGGVGEALSISVPITSQGRTFNAIVDKEMELKVQQFTFDALSTTENISGETAHETKLEQLGAKIDGLKTEIVSLGEKPQGVNDAKIWATLIAVITAVVLSQGRYGLIQSLSTTLVGLFTLATILNLVALQFHGEWAVTWADVVNGMRFQLPPGGDTNVAIVTALAAFGIIGVGASELVAYPYWCLEKGYARFVGPRDDSEEWAERARGWMRVLRWDAWCSMIVYTFATIAFYLLGAAILGRIHLLPEKSELIRTLSVMYEPVFGSIAQMLFLFGAFAVLYSTYFVANAGHARVFPDALRVFGLPTKNEAAHRRRVQFFSALFPLVCLVAYLFFDDPVALVLFSGAMQGIMLPMLAGAALFFRYRRGDHRLASGSLWGTCLWVSAIGMLLTGAWTLWLKGGDLLELIFGGAGS